MLGRAAPGFVCSICQACLGQLPPPRPALSCSYTILMLTGSAPHTTALIVVCSFKAGAHLQDSFRKKTRKLSPPSWPLEKVLPIADTQSLAQNYLKEFLRSE